VRDGVLLKVHNTVFNLSLAVRILEKLPAGLVGLPAGLSGMPHLPLHVPVKLHAGTNA
jgi:hypothetical protein